MPVDRLTHIRQNWQEKGNGPRGRDVDFLLGLVDDHECGDALRILDRVIDEGAERWHTTANHESSLPSWLGLTFEEYAAWVEGDVKKLVALPATESAQPEEERGVKPAGKDSAPAPPLEWEDI